MPIRFRCVYCEQLLGIARRKAGTVVKCPNCAGQVIVPKPEGDDDAAGPDDATAEAEPAQVRQMAAVPEKTVPAPAPKGGGGEGMLFERSDFDELLKPVLERKEPALAGKAGRSSRKKVPDAAPLNAFDFSVPAVPAEEPPVVGPASEKPPAPVVAPATPPKARPGIVFTPVKLILLAVFVMAGMAFAFGGGLLLGLYLGKH